MRSFKIKFISQIAEWGDIINYNSQFTIQPYSTEGNSTTFDLEEIFDENKIVIDWQKEKISFNLYDKSGNIRSSWIYKGNDIPLEGSSRVHINLWLFQGQSPAGNGSLDVLIHNFQYKEFQ